MACGKHGVSERKNTLLWTNRGCSVCGSSVISSPPPGTHPSSAISWHPLQTPSENVSLRARNASNWALSLGLKRIDPAHPFAESSVSAYEKPPTKKMPRNRSRPMFPPSRSVIATSHGWSPAAKTAAAISRSPLEPSWRRMATAGAPSRSVLTGAEGA